MKLKQSGQAVTEFAVALMVFIPLVLFIVIIANMLHVQTTAHKAARYMAWERVAYFRALIKNTRLGNSVNLLVTNRAIFLKVT